jgi:urea transporter
MEPNQVVGYLFTQPGALSGLPRRVAQVADHLESGTLKVGVVLTGLGEAERIVRSVANRLGSALIIVGLLISSALMARVDHTVSLVGFLLSALLGLDLLWRI